MPSIHTKSLLGSLALVLATFAWTGAPTAQMLEEVVVKYDQSQLLKLPRPAAEIIIGNPIIADVSVQSGDLLVVTGKAFGITNMIVLDKQREVILERRIMVRREEARVVNLMLGAKRQTYNCTPQCNPTITIGDEKDYFDAMAKAADRKSGMSDKANDSSQNNN
jgi:Flp pilus assembly secretin CpaC